MMVKEALLVIDAQKVYMSEIEISNVEAILDNINKVITGFKEKSKPIIYVRHMHKPDGSDAGKMYSFTVQQQEIGFLEGSEEVDFIIDATGAPDLEDLSQEQIKAVTARTLSEEFVNVLTTEEFLRARE